MENYMPPKFVVLVVEDDLVHQQLAERIISPHAEVLVAGSLNKAIRFLRDRPDITHAVLDGYVPRFENEPLRSGDTTHDVACEITEIHTGIKAYSASSDARLSDELVQIGCTRATKDSAPRMVVDDILLQQKE